MNRFFTTRFFAIALVMFAWLLFLQPSVATACPTCKSALHDSAAFAFAVSILFMMAMPFIILSFWVVTIVRLRAKAAEIALEIAAKSQKN